MRSRLLNHRTAKFPLGAKYFDESSGAKKAVSIVQDLGAKNVSLSRYQLAREIFRGSRAYGRLR